MKRHGLLILAILVVLMTSNIASAETTVSGNVKFFWDNQNKFSNEYSADITYDLKKDFGFGLAAGLGVKLAPDNSVWYDWGGWATLDFGDIFVAVDSWKEFSAANDFAGGYKLPGGTGVTVDFKQVPDLLVTTYLGSFWTWTEDPDGDWSEKPFHAYAIKGDYDLGDYSVGAGYQGTKVDKAIGGFGIWGSGKVAEGVTAKGEYGYRQDNKSWWEESWGWTSADVEGGGFGLAVTYDMKPLAATLTYLQKDPFFLMAGWENGNVGIAREEFKMKEWTGSLIGLNVNYDVTKYLQVGAQVDYLKDVTDPRDDRNWGKDYEIASTSYKVDASYNVALGTTVSGYFQSWGEAKKLGAGVDYYDIEVDGWYQFDNKEVGATVTYTFVDDFKGIAEIKKADGQDLYYGVRLEIGL